MSVLARPEISMVMESEGETPTWLMTERSEREVETKKVTTMAAKVTTTLTVATKGMTKVAMHDALLIPPPPPLSRKSARVAAPQP